MYFRAIKEFETINHKGKMTKIVPGELVDILRQDDVDELLAKGCIVSPDYRFNSNVGGPIADPLMRTLRIGIWLRTSSWYSGGRIHLYQYALSLAGNGAEVFLITDGQPKWADDYPRHERLRILQYQRDLVPDDLDLVVTDSKDEMGQRACEWLSYHPSIPLACFNFETENWVIEVGRDHLKDHPLEAGQLIDYGKALGAKKTVFQRAALLLANSSESMKYLLPWIGKAPAYTGIVEPAVNTYALDHAPPAGAWEKPSRPYAVWSARSPAYKGGDVAVDAVFGLPFEFDLVAIGQPTCGAKESRLHKIHILSQVSDAVKFDAMRGASIIMAPSLFEGYGMVPAEGLCSGTPVITYDLPVLRQEYGDLLNYVPWGDRKAFCAKVAEVLAAGKPNIDRAAMCVKFGLDAMAPKVDRLPFHTAKKQRVSVQMIAYWGFCPEALESVYPYADEIFIAFGRDAKAQQIDDGSLAAIQGFPDPDKKIKLEVRETWTDKLAMRTWCAEQFTGNRCLLLDGDEIWTGLDAWLAADIVFGCPRWLNLWHGGNFWIHDYQGVHPRWGAPLDPVGSICPHYRWSQWRRSYRFRTHPMPEDKSGHALHNPRTTRAEQVPQAVIYHLGHALPASVMKAKHQYYLDRDGADKGRVKRMTSWHDWNGQTGDCGDGVVAPVTWELPEIVKKALKRMAK